MKKLIALVIAMAFVVAACSSSTEEVVAAYCDELTGLQTAVQDAGSLTNQSTIDDYAAAKDNIVSSYQAAVEAATDVDDAVAAEIEDAQSAYQAAIKDIPSDASVESALITYEAAQKQYAASIKATLAKVSCSA